VNLLNIAIAGGLILGALLMAILSSGMLLPIALPMFFYGFKLMGLKME